MEDKEQVAEVPCLLSPPVYLEVPEQETTNTATTISRQNIKLALSVEEAAAIARPSGCQLIDVTLRNSPSSIRYVVFRNRYTHCITIKCLRRNSSPSEPSNWKVCVQNYILMPSCHCEQGSQSWVVLGEEEGLRGMEEVSKLRLILRQPSPHWKGFGVDHFTCYTATCISPLSLSAPLARPCPHSSSCDAEQVLEKLGELLCLAEESHDYMMTPSTSQLDKPESHHDWMHS